MHTISPKHESPKAVEKKVASIFTRRKEEAGSSAELKSASSPHSRLELPPAPKRKSNVVLEEEDLEIAIVESDSTPKCSQAERKQFMSAFKQPSQEGAKAKQGKVQSKQKKPGDKALEEDGDEAAVGSDISTVPAVEQPNCETMGGKGTKKKPGRRGRKKLQKEEEALSPATQEDILTETKNQLADSNLAEVQATPTSTPTTPAVRRSRREIPVRQAPVTEETETLNPASKTRSCDGSKDAEAPKDSPAQISTPKTPRSKRRVYKAHMISSPDEMESPIRMKFTRVFPTSEAGSDFEILSPIATKVNVMKMFKIYEM